MKKLLLGLLLSVVASNIGAGVSIYATPRAATLPIYSDLNADGAMCSGVMIAPNLMLTAAHCLGAGQLFVAGSPARLIQKNDDTDAALLSVKAGCPCVEVADEDAQIDEPVIAVGFPMNNVVHQQVVTEGLSQGETLLQGQRRLVMTSQVAPGNSGGGVFALRGNYKGGQRWELVGIVSALVIKCDFGMGCSLLPHLAFATTTDALQEITNKK